jgi:sugar/nucleoside kinase (ribokinase family)
MNEGQLVLAQSLRPGAVEMECLSAGILFADVACAPVDGVPDEGELTPADHIQLGLGGCASNTALDLAKLGIEVGVSGCVGDDTFGDFIVKALADGNVDTSGIHRILGMGSACTMIINVKGQDRRFISTAGANMRFAVSHIPADWVRRARVFYVGGYFMMPALETDEMVELFRTARASGAKTVLDVVLYGRDDPMGILARILPETDVFLPNDHEAEVITGLHDPIEQAEAFRSAGARTVVITQGDEGSILVTDGLRLRAGVYPAGFVSGTGSGDAFDAGYIAGLLAGEDPAGCLRWGSALGASCVRSIGATESIFSRPEAEAFMKEHELEMESI